MARRAIGLDIGSFAVRAVELSVGGDAPVLNRFGQVTLPPGAVRNGEVIDTEAVGAAIRRLWSETGLKGRDVVVGIANQRLIVRQAELPALSEEEMRSALQFEAQELIPIPLDEAILDFQPLEQVQGPEGEPRMRVLLAAAQRDMVRTHLAAVERAGLRPIGVDPIPFALIRALTLTPPPAALPGDVRGAEAIVSIGAGVTNVVVHEDGIPRFVRILLVGGEDISEAVAAELDIDVDTAEDLKRRADPNSMDAAVAEAARIVNDRTAPIVEEIRGSLDYYLAQADAEPLSRVLVTGGASRMPGLVDRLQQVLGDRVEVARPLTGVRIGRVGLSDAELAQAEPLLAVPIGLALAGAPAPAGIRRITLLPSEVAVVREQRRQVVLMASGIAGFMVLLLLLWALQGARLANERREAEREEAVARDLQRQVAALGNVNQLEVDLRQRQQVVRSVLVGDVAWTRLVQEVATVIPNDVWLTSFVAQKGAPGTVTFAAMGFDQTSTARWLLRVGELKALTDLWVPNSTKGQDSDVTTFTSTANLTPAAAADRAAQYLGDDA